MKLPDKKAQSTAILRCQEILKKYCKYQDTAYFIYLEHSLSVAKKALFIAKKNLDFNPDLDFIFEAALLHDIGIFLTKALNINCYGKHPYITHGVLGREILEKENLKKHALVCERHIGVGLTKKEIIEKKLPLPARDMIPVSIEEEIICLADKFYSKNPKFLGKEKSVKQIKEGLEKFGIEKIKKLDLYLKKYNLF
jgi:uncharacterized protein